MADLSPTVAPNSEQLNADDFIAGPRTLTIARVNARRSAKDQPVDVYFEGDETRPWKPCKSMRRVLIAMWGPNSDVYPGRRITLFNDPEVTFGKDKVGGIRIASMSHISGPRSIALTATRGSRKPFTVKPLGAAPRDPDDAPPPDREPPGAGAVSVRRYLDRDYRPDHPCKLPLPDDAEPAIVKMWGVVLRELITLAPSPGYAITWGDLNADLLLRVGDQRPDFAAWIRAAIPAPDADTETDDANGADAPGNTGAASSAPF